MLKISKTKDCAKIVNCNTETRINCETKRQPTVCARHNGSCRDLYVTNISVDFVLSFKALYVKAPFLPFAERGSELLCQHAFFLQVHIARHVTCPAAN